MAQIQYLTGSSFDAARELAQQRDDLGILATPLVNYRDHVSDYPAWAADNGCYSQGDRFDLDGYLAWLEAWPAAERERCLFAPAPDVVGDALATFERSRPVLSEIRARGFRPAYVAQDGIEHAPPPWRDFDVLFLGGSTEWKLGPVARNLTTRAIRLGKRVHMGRVNSYKRLRYAAEIGCSSADGTFLAFGPRTNLPRLAGWLDRLAAEAVEAVAA